MGRGGRRPGAGRKPKPRDDQGRVLMHPSSAGLASSAAPPPESQAPVEVFEAPASLSPEERAVWDRQAPHAFAARTLTRASALAFARYCQIVVLEQAEAKSSGRGGTNHRGLLKQINAYELQFLLVPCGKPLAGAVTAAVRDDDDAFFGGAGARQQHA